MGNSCKTKTIYDTHFCSKAHEDLGAGNELRSLWIEIPAYCHLGCGYCFASATRGCAPVLKDVLSEKQYIDLLTDFRDEGGKFLGIPGNGEPFHSDNRDLTMAILRHASKIGLSTTVFTTADSLFYSIDGKASYKDATLGEPDLSLMDELKAYDVIFLVKCNSLKAEVQDKLVGQKGYTKVREQAMRLLMDNYKLHDKKRLGIVTSILPENRGEILELHEYAHINNLIFDCDTILPRGRGETWLNGHDLKPQEYEEIYAALDDREGGTLSSGGSYVGVACDRIKHHLYVDIHGDVYPCIGCVDRHHALRLGSFPKQSLTDIWKNTKRVLLRDNLEEITVGPCSWCGNFQESCWSCLGRTIERVELTDDGIILHSSGCFNHRPKWEKWLEKCESHMRTVLGEMPALCEGDIKKDVEKLGREAYWQQMPSLLAEDDCVFPWIQKDYTRSELNVPGKELWRLVDIRFPEDREDISPYALESLQGLLPSVMLPMLKVLLDAHDKPDISTVGQDTVIQFINLMIYMPRKKRYFYRTISAGGLGPCSNDNEELHWEKTIKQRKAQLIQRWAEALADDGKQDSVPILPHIQNFSHLMEHGYVGTYELILARDLYDETKNRISIEVVHDKHAILCIQALLESKPIKEHIAQLNEFVERCVNIPGTEWDGLSDSLTGRILAYPEGFEDENQRLLTMYEEMASSVFLSSKDLDSGLIATVNNLVTQVIQNNLVFHPESTEKEWKELLNKRVATTATYDLIEQLWSCLKADDLKSKDWVLRKQCIRHGTLPPFFESVKNPTDRRTLASRLYNPLLLGFVKQFFDLNTGEMQPDWHKALNYFIWLGCWSHHLGVSSYYVVHAPNLQHLAKATIGKLSEDLSPSGMILSCRSRLTPEARALFRQAFRTIMDPVEELDSMGEWWESGRGEGIHQSFHTIKTKLGHIVSSFPPPPYDHRLSNRDIEEYDKSLGRLRKIQCQVHSFYLMETDRDPEWESQDAAEFSSLLERECKELQEAVRRLRWRTPLAIQCDVIVPERAQSFRCVPTLCAAVLFEVFWNLFRHAESEAEVSWKIDNNEVFTLVVRNTAKSNAFENIKLGELTPPHPTGLGMIKRVEAYLTLPPWKVTILDEASRLVEFRYPLAFLENKDGGYNHAE